MKKTLLNLFTGYKQPPRFRTLIFGVVCTLLMTGSVLAASHSVEPQARYSGSYGLQLVFDDTDPSYVEDDSPVSEKRYRARFYVDMSALTLGAGDSFTLFIGYHDADANGPDDGDEIEFELSVLESSGEKLLMARVWQDDDSFVPLASGIAIEGGWHSIEIDWETGFSGNSGLFDIWLDGEKQTGIAGLDNEEAAVDFVRWGAVFGNPGTIAGRMDLDEFASERMDYIGVNVLDAGCSGDEVTMDTGVFTIPDDIPVLCKATRSFTTIEGQKVVIGQSSNLRIESPSTTLMPGVQVKVGGIFAVGN